MPTLSLKNRMAFIITKSVKLRGFATDWGDFRLEKAQNRRLFLKMSDIFPKMPYLFFKTSGLFREK